MAGSRFNHVGRVRGNHSSRSTGNEESESESANGEFHSLSPLGKIPKSCIEVLTRGSILVMLQFIHIAWYY